MAFPWIEVAAIATAAGAGAAWRSALASSEAVARTHRPFVWPDWRYEHVAEGKGPEWSVRLHNDGPGVALDVRWSVYVLQPPEEFGGRADFDPTQEMRRNASEPIRGMRPGTNTGWMSGTSESGFEEWVVVRFTDSAGSRWEYHEPWDVDDLAEPVRRLQKVRRRRGLRVRLWRLRHRPLRESIRQRPDW